MLKSGALLFIKKNEEQRSPDGRFTVLLCGACFDISTYIRSELHMDPCKSDESRVRWSIGEEETNGKEKTKRPGLLKLHHILEVIVPAPEESAKLYRISSLSEQCEASSWTP